MNNLKVALVQQDIFWEDEEKNISHLDKLLTHIKSKADLVVLPEMFHSGFTMHPHKVAQSMSGKVIQWMKKKAEELDACLMGSVVYTDGVDYFNRLFVFFADGNYQYYDKRHLFSMGNETKHYKRGENRLIFDYKGWKICPLVCYDLRFPVWSRNQDEYDLLVYVANWPKVRIEVWSTLLRARAIENQSYVVGVNRVGQDISAYYSGDSVALDAKGKAICELNNEEETVKIVELNKVHQDAFRKKFPVWKDSDDFHLVK
ncbi:amidohydrolase [Carboxylicivirga linearis]|uniref:Amidohydrolase n=1 Tax=Carboxylicivirga linearis TaxID=1628157 RepID=A0ABS5K078_9BACT|nr:amidohydrolase [Carboxylicivirga linearis]MBS2100536.1 amidohydrolase [Carboxylicivirga linearis]